ncbi:hypothetical protein D9M70_409640 [compost metagenome]
MLHRGGDRLQQFELGGVGRWVEAQHALLLQVLGQALRGDLRDLRQAHGDGGSGQLLLGQGERRHDGFGTVWLVVTGSLLLHRPLVQLGLGRLSVPLGLLLRGAVDVVLLRGDEGLAALGDITGDVLGKDGAQLGGAFRHPLQVALMQALLQRPVDVHALDVGMLQDHGRVDCPALVELPLVVELKEQLQQVVQIAGDHGVVGAVAEHLVQRQLGHVGHALAAVAGCQRLLIRRLLIAEVVGRQRLQAGFHVLVDEPLHQPGVLDVAQFQVQVGLADHAFERGVVGDHLSVATSVLQDLGDDRLGQVRAVLVVDRDVDRVLQVPAELEGAAGQLLRQGVNELVTLGGCFGESRYRILVGAFVVEGGDVAGLDLGEDRLAHVLPVVGGDRQLRRHRGGEVGVPHVVGAHFLQQVEQLLAVGDALVDGRDGELLGARLPAQLRV